MNVGSADLAGEAAVAHEMGSTSSRLAAGVMLVGVSLAVMFPVLEQNRLHQVPYFEQAFAEPRSASVTASLAGVLAAAQSTNYQGTFPSPSQQTSHTSAQVVRDMQQASGLTWQQLAKALGVSRRSLHLWANGAAMSALHSESVAQFEAIVRACDSGDPQATRLALLRTGDQGLSPYDRFRSQRDAETARITGPALTAAELTARDQA